MLNQDSKKILKYFFLALGAVLLVLGCLRLWQLYRTYQESQRLSPIIATEVQERDSADSLLQRTNSLQTLRDELLLPQVELNIKL